MKNLIKALLCVCFLVTLVSAGHGGRAKPKYIHGGTYNGPGDTVPPGGGSSPGGGGAGPTSPTPGGPTSPGSPGSPGGGVGSPGAPGSPGVPAGPITAGGTAGPDLTQWSFWWEFNKDPYLALKSSIFNSVPLTGTDDFFLGHGQQDQARDVLKPTAHDLKTKVVPALLNMLEKETNNDIITGSMMALAKIGNMDGEFQFQYNFIPFLKDSNQEIAETAALALGILGEVESVEMLIDLATDGEKGRKLVGEISVPGRTRAFSTYALGLIGEKSQDEVMRLRVSHALRDIYLLDDSSYRDIKVAAIVSLSLVDLKHDTDQLAVVAFLMDILRNQGVDKFVRAHVPEAVVLNLRGVLDFHDQKLEVANEFVNLLGVHSKESKEVQQSCTLALGLLGTSDDQKVNSNIREMLMKLPEHVNDQQTRNFALIALAYSNSTVGLGPDSFAGVQETYKYFMRQLARGKSVQKAWAGLSAGILVNRLEHQGFPVPTSWRKSIVDALRMEKQPERLGALAVAIGLAGGPDAGEVLLDKVKTTQDDEAKGYLCIGLGLLGERKAIEYIQEVVEKSKYRPLLLQQAAISLGLMGDYNLVPYLTATLENSTSLASQASIVQALGFIGDARSIDSLVGMLEDKQVTDRGRGFAAAALGMVAERNLLPWNNSLSCDLNYRASTFTLNDIEGTGILNIL